MAERPAAGRRFFRLVRNDPAGESDFYSQEKVGRKPRPNLTPIQLHAFRDGVSVDDSEAGARARATRFRANPNAPTYPFVAIIDVPAGSPITCDDAIGPPGHWTLYGSPNEQLACVTEPIIVL